MKGSSKENKKEHDAGQKKTLKLREKRVVTFNLKLAQKQKYEINKQMERSKSN